ncbi:LuxR C-terminal-related transcriptional regulator [Treponema sp. OttesenSCG-928-L16]|nr:LuxR C-terminal-related transcriptional regulator [Treponema sp. OttesenSCG-928-L16]
MPHQSTLPVHQGLLHRPRLHSLIEKGLEHSLLVFLAGPGFGKTQAMSDYLSQCDARILWLRLTGLDNLHTHFWDHFLRSLEQEFPDIVKRIESLEFPDSIVKFNLFLQALLQESGRKKRIIWVFDDFGEIVDQRIKDFFRMMADLDLEYFRLVLISNTLANPDPFSFVSDRQFLITKDDLRFNKEEIAGLYRMHDILLEADEVNRIEQYTEGWPLPLHLMVLQHERMPPLSGREGELTHNGISHLFGARFFSAYPKEQQKLLVGLSQLDSFTKKLLVSLYEGSPADLETFTNHVFIANEPSTGHFFFHHLYRLFLQEKKHLLSPEEELRMWQKAAEYYGASGDIGDTLQAIACYRKCGDHIGMLNVICDITKWQHEVTTGNAAFFLEHLDLLSPEELKKHPVADHLRAMIYMNMVELEKSEALLLDLEQRLLAEGTPEAFTLLGDVYATLGFIHMMSNQEDFGSYYKKALGYLPEGTKYKAKTHLHTQNVHNFSMADNLPGAKERMERAVHDAVPWMARFLYGGMSGMEHIFSAEAAYLSYDLDAAQQHAYRAIYKAEANAQHDLVCNGFCILARIGLLRGNFTEISKHIQSIVSYVDKYEFAVLREIRDTVLAWFYVKMRDFSRIPNSILTINDSDQPLLSYGRGQIVYANYLINTGEYAKLIGMLEHPKGLYLTRGIWPDRICLFIMLAVGYYHLGNQDSAMEALWTAYDMSYNNGLITLFIEGDKHMGALIDMARQQEVYAFDHQWLNLIAKESAAFSKRAAVVRNAYKKQGSTKTVKQNPLTRREMEILQDLSRGLTREEISVEQGISVNTIKSFIRTIYNKLDATNRAEAVSIAILNGYIEV